MALLPRPSELRSLEPFQIESVPAASLALTLLIPARNAGHSLGHTVSEAHGHLEARYGEDFEIIVIVNPPSEAHADDGTLKVARELALRFKRTRVLEHKSPTGKGANLRAGFLASRGRLIFFTDADLPYDLSFLDEACEGFVQGYDFVTGNRRLPSSVFRVSVNLLPLAYGRHRLGLGFNSVVRRALGIPTTDTQAGIKGMTRELASLAFSRQRCPGFFFDLELFLVARNFGFQWKELSVILHLNSEKSTVRVFRESLLAAFWLGSIFWANRLGAYGRKLRSAKIPALYPSRGFKTQAFLQARWSLTPYSLMASRLPPSGDILDLGCGHGLLAMSAALAAPRRQILGIDHDEQRIRAAETAAERSGCKNVRFQRGSLLEIPEGRRFAGITLIDVMHYFDPETQKTLIARAFSALQPGGKLLIREVNPSGGIISKWNRLYERLATLSGFTQAEGTLHFRSVEAWEECFAEAGFEVSHSPCSSPLFSDVLFVCQRRLASGEATA